MISGGLITSNTWLVPLLAWLFIGSILFEIIKDIREKRRDKKYREAILAKKQMDTLKLCSLPIELIKENEES